METCAFSASNLFDVDKCSANSIKTKTLDSVINNGFFVYRFSCMTIP